MTACRACGKPLTVPFVDLGEQPLANGYLKSPDDPDPRYPLRAWVCDGCLLVQADTTVSPADLFSEYAFFSGASRPWADHCRAYAEKMRERFDPRRVLEVASNDGTLLACFDGLDVLGVDPAANVAITAPIPTVAEFFTAELAEDLPASDLVIANNVLGHVPDLNDFVTGLATVLKPEGVLTIEVPWLWNLIRAGQYDTIYHEHFSYWSLYAARELFEAHGLRIFDVEHLDVHGGSLRIYLCHRDAHHETRPAVRDTLQVEFDKRLDIPDSASYTNFQMRVDRHVARVRKLFGEGKRIVGAGAPAKGNTLLNAAGLTAQEMRFTTDTSPHKQGMYLPGSHIPIYPPDALRAHRPEFVFLLAWNWADAIIKNLSFVREWGGRFIVPNPDLKIL